MIVNYLMLQLQKRVDNTENARTACHGTRRTDRQPHSRTARYGRVQAGRSGREIGISAIYLNLIEHNRRRIGGKTAVEHAAASLEVEPQWLTEGAEAALIATLREARQVPHVGHREAGPGR